MSVPLDEPNATVAPPSSARSSRERRAASTASFNERDRSRAARAAAVVPPHFERRRAGVRCAWPTTASRLASGPASRRGPAAARSPPPRCPSARSSTKRRERLDDERRVAPRPGRAASSSPFSSTGTSGLTRSAEHGPGLREDQHLRRSRKILDCQPRELGARSLADLPLDGGDDDAERDRADRSTCPSCAHGVRWRTARTSARNGSSGWPRDVEAEDLLLLRRGARTRSSGGMLGSVRTRGVCDPSSSPTLAEAASPGPLTVSCCASDASCSAPSSAAQYCARCPPSESSAPDAISASNTRLLQRRRSTRSHEIVERGEGAAVARGEDRIDRRRGRRCEWRRARSGSACRRRR